MEWSVNLTRHEIANLSRRGPTSARCGDEKARSRRVMEGWSARTVARARDDVASRHADCRKRRKGKEEEKHASNMGQRDSSLQVATYSTVIKKSGQVISAYYVASLTVICLKQYNVGYGERATHLEPRDLIKLTWSGIIAPLPRDSRLSLPVTQSEMRRRVLERPKVTKRDRENAIGRVTTGIPMSRSQITTLVALSRDWMSRMHIPERET